MSGYLDKPPRTLEAYAAELRAELVDLNERREGLRRRLDQELMRVEALTQSLRLVDDARDKVLVMLKHLGCYRLPLE